MKNDLNKKTLNIVFGVIICVLIGLVFLSIKGSFLDEENILLKNSKSNEAILEIAKKASDYNDHIKLNETNVYTKDDVISMGINELDLAEGDKAEILKLFNDATNMNLEVPVGHISTIYKLEIKYAKDNVDFSPVLIIKDAETDDLIKYDGQFMIARASPIAYQRDGDTVTMILAGLKENKDQKIYLEYAYNEKDTISIYE